MTVSVALATYNGQRYLLEQLHSMAQQTRLPDEIVLGDDGSTDGTEQIVRAFTATHRDIAVHWHRNPQRLGSSANFAAIAGRCTGDIVVFSDQDDAWLPQRVQLLCEALAARPDCQLAFSNGTLMDGDGAELPGSLFDSIDFGPDERRDFAEGAALDVLLRRNVVTGAAAAVRREAMLAVLPIGAGWVHDYFLAIALACSGGIVLLDQPLIRYRMHAAQQVGVARGSLAGVLRYARKQSGRWVGEEARQWQELAERLRGTPLDDRLGREAVLRAIGSKAAFVRARAAMRERPWTAPWMVATAAARGDYGRYSLGWKQGVVDLVAAALALCLPR